MFIYQWFLPHITSGFRVKYGMTSPFSTLNLKHRLIASASMSYRRNADVILRSSLMSYRTAMRYPVTKLSALALNVILQKCDRHPTLLFNVIPHNDAVSSSQAFWACSNISNSNAKSQTTAPCA